MKCRDLRTAWSLTLLITATWLCVFILSCSAFIRQDNAGLQVPGSSFFLNMLGSARIALSAHFYDIAETYFHRGKARLVPQAFHDSIFQRMSANIHPQIHQHRAGEDTREIMPWLWLATRTDPTRIDQYIAASFWLSRELHRNDLALSVLQEAKWRNPFQYRVLLEEGVLFLHENKRESATQAFNAALAFWPSSESPQGTEALQEKARALLYRALLFEAEGKKDKAIEDLQAILTLFPKRTELQDRIRELKENDQPSLLASQVWGDMLKKESESRTSHDQCTYDHDGHSGEHDHEHEAH